MTENPQFQRVGSGCGLQGCLFAAVAIFVLLLIGTLIIGIFRFSEPPQGVPRPPVGVSAVCVPAVDCLRLADGRRPRAGEEGRGETHG